jgi:hypothetical protein
MLYQEQSGNPGDNQKPYGLASFCFGQLGKSRTRLSVQLPDLWPERKYFNQLLFLNGSNLCNVSIHFKPNRNLI